jgi:hypothetical protein
MLIPVFSCGVMPVSFSCNLNSTVLSKASFYLKSYFTSQHFYLCSYICTSFLYFLKTLFILFKHFISYCCLFAFLCLTDLSCYLWNLSLVSALLFASASICFVSSFAFIFPPHAFSLTHEIIF